MVFSIIIPVYNVVPYLRECLDSVLAQTYADWECICVDDGSTDGSAAILDEYAVRDSRFKILHQQNRGVSAARNAGLEIAVGAWIWFIDGDDQIHPGALGIFARQIAETQSLAGIHLGRIVSETPPTSWGLSSFGVQKFENLTSLQMIEFMHAAWNFVLSREFIGDLRFLDYKLNEDMIFMMTLVWKPGTWSFVDATLYFWRQRASSACHQKRPSRESVQSVFETERMIVSMFEKELKRKHLDIDGALRHYANRLFYTYFRMYFQLSLVDRVRLYGEWLDLQLRMSRLVKLPSDMKVRLAFVKIFRSGLFVRYLALYNDWLVNLICRLHSLGRRVVGP